MVQCPNPAGPHSPTLFLGPQYETGGMDLGQSFPPNDCGLQVDVCKRSRYEAALIWFQGSVNGE